MSYFHEGFCRTKSGNTNATDPSSLLQPPVPPKKPRKRSSFEVAIDADQSAIELPHSPGAQSHSSAQSDADMSELMLSLKRKRQRREDEGKQKRGWIDRYRFLIKCCVCETEVLASNKCSCSHKFCVFCFRYEDDPELLQEIPDTERDELRKVVGGLSRCREECKSDS